MVKTGITKSSREAKYVDLLIYSSLNNMRADGLPAPLGFSTDTPLEEEQGKEERGRAETLRPLKDLKAEATKYIEKKAILHALNMTGWNKRRAADLLKISYKALFYKMAELGIEKAAKLNNTDSRVP